MPEYRSNQDVLYYDRAGEGETPVIFIHGFLASSKMWRDSGYLDSLPANYSAYVPDMRGHGRSNAIKYECDLKHMAQDVAALINDQALIKPIVVGMSMGGGVGLKLAIDSPDILRGLVLISPGFGSPMVGLKKLLYPLLPYAAQRAGLLARLLKSAFVKLPHDEIIAGLLEDAMKVSRETWQQFMNPGNTLDDHKDLKKINVPVCFIFGEQDTALPPKLQHRMADLIPNARKVAYPDEGHGVVAENPSLVMKDMFGFFDQLQRSVS